MLKRFFAEFLATAILVLIGCGTAMGLTLAGQANDAGAVAAIAAAFGLSIMVLAYAVGPISGGHANPAVSFAKFLVGELNFREFRIYCCAQILGAFFGSLLLALVMWSWGTGVSGANIVSDVMIQAGNRAGGPFMTYMLSTMAEMGLTFLFVIAVLGVTSKKEWSGFAGIVIGLALFGVHLVGIPLTGTSVNPARALSALVFSMFNGQDVGMKALCLIPAILGPIMGAFTAASVFKAFYGKKNQEEAKAE